MACQGTLVAVLRAAVLSGFLCDALRWPRTVGRGRLNGDADLQDGWARLGVDADRATVALLDDASCDVKTKTRALAHVLCGVERLECAGRYVPWHAGAGVADFNDDVSPVSPGRYSQSAGAVHRVDGVIDEVGPHLVEFAGVGLDPGDDTVVTHDVDVVELVAEHHQGAFEAVADVDALDRSSVHLGVGLDGGDEVRNAPSRLLQLQEERSHRQGARHPFKARFQGGFRQHGRHSFAPAEVGARDSKGWGDDPVMLDAVAGQPRGQRLFLVSHL